MPSSWKLELLYLACESLQAGSLSYFTPAILLLKFSKKNPKITDP
jgi:hypothetical protein